MKQSRKKYQGGFTLIESVIYLALFAIIIGGGMTAAYQIIVATQAAHNHIILNQEANFLIKKIDWGLHGATGISASGSTLTMTNTISGNPTQLVFSKDGAVLMLKRGSGAAMALNSSGVLVDSVSFVKNAGLNGAPDSIVITLSLTTFQYGTNTSQTFSITQYVR